MTKQAAWQRRQVANGRCRQCGRPSERMIQRCDACVGRDKARRTR